MKKQMKKQNNSHKQKELEQLQNGLSIERLTDNIDNKRCIRSFSNSRNDNLEEYLKRAAWGEDKERKTAVYLIKYEGEIVCYFALRCGMLLRNGKKKSGEMTEPELDQNHICVNATVPAMEIAHFCMNERWTQKYEVAKGIGSIIFYRYILPLIYQSGRYAGCKYVYLYAADETEDETLVKYYESLFFKKISDVDYYHVFPRYDMRCVLMFAALDVYKKIDVSYVKDLGLSAYESGS